MIRNLIFKLSLEISVVIRLGISIETIAIYMMFNLITVIQLLLSN